MGDERSRPTGDRPKGLEDAHIEPTVEELRREQRREAGHTTYLHTQAQVHGALIGAVVAGLIGLGLGVIIALSVFDSGSPARVVVPVVVAVFAGWAGLVYGGGRAPEVEHETMTIYGEPQDGSSARAPENESRAP
ncbi:MAG: hypothetical protein ABWZ52_12995 [Acidimicrobiales bacterium]